MEKLSKKQKEEIIKKIQDGEPIPDQYRFLIPFETEREYELTYAGKERKEDVLADTLSVPFQAIKKFGEAKADEWRNMLIFGDNLQALKHLLKLKEQGKLRNPDGRSGVKLVYIDPPFGTGDIYDAAPGTPAYSAKLRGAEFLDFLRKRLIFLKQLLTDDGSIFIRIDYHFGHYVKAIMDEVFEKSNFINEILVGRGRNVAGAIGKMEVDNDFILWYSISPQKYIFNEIRVSRPISEIKWTSFLMAGERFPRERIFMGRRITPPKGQHFALIQEKVDKLLNDYFLRLKCRDCGALYYYATSDADLFKKMKQKENRFKFYDVTSEKILHGIQKLQKCSECENENFTIEYLGSDEKKISNIWLDIESYSKSTGYPTENSEQLLDRVIELSSHEGDIVLDCFAGSGTTGAVSEKLGRKWIMIDSSKLAIYTIQKRMLNLTSGIGTKGKSLKPKPFVLYNAGLYLDSGFIEKMDEEDYMKFVLELFSAEPSEHSIKGIKMHGILNNRPVMVFSQRDFLTYEFIEDLHKTVGSGLKDEMYIIVPMSIVRFNEDYVDKGKIRYHVLKVPYSIIQKIMEKKFFRGLQPISKENINQTIESLGFDFIYPPKVESEYYQGKEGSLFDQLVIKIKKFEPVQISKRPVEFEDPKKEALSMVMIDKDYDGIVFDMDHYFFGDEIVKNDYKIVFPKPKADSKIMIIYLDVLGNEKLEVKNIKDFKIR